MPPEDTLTSEWDLITALSREFGPAPPGVILGIGDDCAAIEIPGPDYLLWTVDTLVEGVHFDLAYTSLAQLGWKSLAVNLSDIAAMGGDPGRPCCPWAGPRTGTAVGPCRLPPAWPRPPGSTAWP